MTEDDDKIVYLWGKDELPENDLVDWEEVEEDEKLYCHDCGGSIWSINYDIDGDRYIVCQSRLTDGAPCGSLWSIP